MSKWREMVAFEDELGLIQRQVLTHKHDICLL
jgi:hypothetical protein